MTNYDELVKRLRLQAEWVSSGINEDCNAAADAITRLQADLKEAVEAHNHIAKTWPDSFAARMSRRIVAKHEGKKG